MSRHLLIAELDEDLLRLICFEGATIRCTAGMPEDARFVGASFNFARNRFDVAFEHPSFPETAPGLRPPSGRIAFEVVARSDRAPPSTIPVWHATRYELVNKEDG